MGLAVGRPACVGLAGGRRCSPAPAEAGRPRPQAMSSGCAGSGSCIPERQLEAFLAAAAAATEDEVLARALAPRAPRRPRSPPASPVFLPAHLNFPQAPSTFRGFQDLGAARRAG